MLTSKQRAQLRGMASTMESILTVGKGGIGEMLVKQAADALLKRELIKGHVLETCEYSAREAAEEIAAQTGAEVVCAIGNRFVLYKQHPKKPVIELVGTKKRVK
ncbi:MAG TPA: ribosome assembly RNA-binding protein YhbY [Ruminococcus sp.]|nr:ribosome assembly RNA-binding protein YhbY [Ruminococcus sp.]